MLYEILGNHRHVLFFLQTYEFSMKETNHLPDLAEDDDKTPPRKIKPKKRPM